MNLIEFSRIVGGPSKWTSNALQVLRRPRDYTFGNARILRLTKVFNREFGVALKPAWQMAQRVLDEPDERTAWTFNHPGSGVTIGVDRERFLSSLSCSLSATRVWHPRPARGRPSGQRPLEQRLMDSATDLPALIRSIELPIVDRLERIDAAFELVATDRHPDPSLGELLSRLVKARVEFLVHGAMAAALHGALTIPSVLDIRPDPERRNIERLSRVLREIGASLRGVGPGLPFLLDDVTLVSEPIIPMETPHGSITVHRKIPDLVNPESTAPVHAIPFEEGEFLLLGIGSVHESLVGRGTPESEDVATQVEAIMELDLEG
jgi:hypothetical protein